MEERSELKPCPFCGSTEKPSMMPFGGRREWNLSHYCPKTEDGYLTTVINIYGKSRDEVIERWNGRSDNEQRKAD